MTGLKTITDVHVMDSSGRKIHARRLPEGIDGMRVFHEPVAAHVDDPAEVIVGTETERGLWVTARLLLLAIRCTRSTGGVRGVCVRGGSPI